MGADDHDRTAADADGVGDGSGGHRHELPGGIGDSAECLACPVCALLQAVTQSRPEVTQHLLAAARELTLALKAVVETQAAAYDDAAPSGSGDFQRINLD